MCAYLSRAEDECSHAMNQTLNEVMAPKLTNYDQMKSVAGAYSMKRECSVQEAVYHIMPEFWLRKTFPVVVFPNIGIPENRFRVCLDEREMKGLRKLNRYFQKKKKIWLIDMWTGQITINQKN